MGVHLDHENATIEFMFEASGINDDPHSTVGVKIKISGAKKFPTMLSEYETVAESTRAAVAEELGLEPAQVQRCSHDRWVEQEY